MQFVDTISLALIFKHCPLERPQNCQHLYLKPMIEKTNDVNKKKSSNWEIRYLTTMKYF